MILYLLSRVHQTCDRINVIMFISFPILIQFHIISYLYHIMCTKRALRVSELGMKNKRPKNVKFVFNFISKCCHVGDTKNNGQFIF